jgi:hypothetical protein
VRERQYDVLTPPLLEIRSRVELRVDAVGATPGVLLSAASGLVRRGGRLYVVADDEHHLAVIDTGSGEGHWVRLFEGYLPDKPKKRKAAKPDLETLIELPTSSELPHGGLLALGSGSRPNRHTGVIVPFDAHGELTVLPRLIDLALLYAPLQHKVGDLNVEGGLHRGNDFLLLQRASQGQARNVCMSFAWHEVEPWLFGTDRAAPQVHEHVVYDLGTIDGVALGFTDAAALPDGAWVFSAVAEATNDSYYDGACVGSAIGLIAADGRLRSLRRLEGSWKVEGIAATLLADETLQLTLVTDADDRSQPASCLTVHVHQ